MRMSARRLFAIIGTCVAALALAGTVPVAQQPARPADVPTLPPRGPLSVTPAAITEIVGGIKAPAGFEV